MHIRVVANFQQEVELFLEKGIVVIELQAEERIRLDERATAGDDFGAPVGDEVERSELLEDADGIGGAKNGNGTREADIFRTRRCGGENDRRRRVEEFG